MIALYCLYTTQVKYSSLVVRAGIFPQGLLSLVSRSAIIKMEVDVLLKAGQGVSWRERGRSPTGAHGNCCPI